MHLELSGYASYFVENKTEHINMYVVNAGLFKACCYCGYASIDLPSASVEETNVKSPLLGGNCMITFI